MVATTLFLVLSPFLIVGSTAAMNYGVNVHSQPSDVYDMVHSANIGWVRRAQSPYSVNVLAVVAARAAVSDLAFVNEYVRQVGAARTLAAGGRLARLTALLDALRHGHGALLRILVGVVVLLRGVVVLLASERLLHRELLLRRDRLLHVELLLFVPEIRIQIQAKTVTYY